ncbi:MAG: ABC transporter substrate-binding protein [Actinomycetota bacterium]
MPGYHLPYVAAADNGIFERHGLEVEIIDPEPGPDNIRAVAAGRYDACLTSVAHFLTAKKENPDLPARFVFMVTRLPHMALFTVAGREARNGRAVVSFEDLEGATFIGPAGSGFEREYQVLMRHLSLVPGPVVDMSYGRALKGLMAGDGDVTADHLDLLPRFVSAARRAGVQVHPLPFYEAGLDHYGSGLVVGTRLIEERAHAVQTLRDATRETLIATRRDPLAGLAALQKRLPGVDAERALQGWTAGEPLIFVDGSDDHVGDMDAATWERTLAWHAAVDDTRAVSPENVYELSFAAADPAA